MKWIPRFLTTSPFLFFCFVLFFRVQLELRSPPLPWSRLGLLMRGSVGYLSPSHHILANLNLPRDPRTEGPGVGPPR